MKDQYGSAGRDQFNVGRDLHIHKNGKNAVQNKQSRSGKDDGSNNTKAAGGIGGLIVVAIVIFLIANSSSGASPPTVRFPARGSRWPVGATTISVMAPILTRLQACAKAPVLTPVNCPQAQVSPDPSSVADVHWSLHGNPADGAKILFSRNQFVVGGTAIMLVKYSDYNGGNLAVDVVHYRAYVDWRNGQGALSRITDVSAASGPRVVKHRPNFTWNQIANAVLNAFDYCIRERSVPLSPQCPTEQNSYITSGNAARWHLTADPLSNIQENFDSASGLIYVTGSYAMSVSYSTYFGSQQASESGNYNAAVAVDGTRMDVLQIASS